MTMSRKSALTKLVQKYLGTKVEIDERKIVDLYNLIDGNQRTNEYMFRKEWKTIKRAYRDFNQAGIPV
jgi:hypothetical protein